jgi:hypothetical protein
MDQITEATRPRPPGPGSGSGSGPETSNLPARYPRRLAHCFKVLFGPIRSAIRTGYPA